MLFFFFKELLFFCLLRRFQLHIYIQSLEVVSQLPDAMILLFLSFFPSVFFWDNFFKRVHLFIFREGKGGRKRERNINVWLPLAHPLQRTWPAIQACALTRNQTCDPLVLRPPLNPPLRHHRTTPARAQESLFFIVWHSVS